MENPFRRFLAVRILAPTASAEPKQSLDDLALHSVSYESTSPSGKLPIFIHQPLRNGTASRQSKDDLDGFAIRAFSYSSTLAGKPPIVGGRPLKGNGPVKLQTSRRLSSGELLATSEDPNRTLEDIREGEYIVGGKENRLSSRSQATSLSPAAGNAMQLRLRSMGSASSASSSPHLPMARTVSRDSVKSTFMASSLRIHSSTPSSPHVSSFGNQVHEDVASCPTFESPSVAVQYSEASVPVRPVKRGSLLTQDEEQNATIQALWRAECSRLIAIYGKSGIDRNIVVLNGDRQPTPLPVKTRATREVLASTEMRPNPMRKASLDTSFDFPTRRLSPLSSVRDTSSIEEISDYASTIRSSVTSDGGPNSQTIKSSGLVPNLPNTREDVRKAVENMRSTYLRALEARENQSTRPKIVKKKKERASYSAAGHVPSKASGDTKTLSRQSWHSSNTPSAPSQVISVKRNETREEPEVSEDLESSPTDTLQRADSMTLGSLMPSTPPKSSSKRNSKPLKSPQSPPTPRATLESPADLKVQHQSPVYHRDNVILGPEIAPELEDFDIFYQGLYGPLPSASSMPSLPARKHSSLHFPSPTTQPLPDIEWTSRERYVSQI